MDLQTRKIEFIQEVLQIQSEEVIERLEDLLKREKTEPMDAKMLNGRIDISEADFANNRFKKSSELIDKYR